MNEVREQHRVYYEDADGRQNWECQDCSCGGSVGEFGDPEAAAERAHGFPTSTINKRVT